MTMDSAVALQFISKANGFCQTCEATHGFRVSAEEILTRAQGLAPAGWVVLVHVAMGTVHAHANPSNTRQHHKHAYQVIMHSAQRIFSIQALATLQTWEVQSCISRFHILWTGQETVMEKRRSVCITEPFLLP